MDDSRKKAVIEALVFLSSKPITVTEIKAVTSFQPDEIRKLAGELIEEYKERDGGLLMGAVAEGYRMHSSPECAEWTRKLTQQSSSQKLSLPALETLSIVAYKQPITKAEIEAIRGVNADGVVKSLLERRLIKIAGKKEAPGRPILYTTTREFLEHFGLENLSSLPTLKDLEREEG